MMPKIYGVANQKGGVGKTTLAMNFAVGLNQHGSCVVIDTERPRPSVSTGGTEPAISTPRTARQGDQSPPASLYRPWDNLHPERIWPD